MENITNKFNTIIKFIQKQKSNQAGLHTFKLVLKKIGNPEKELKSIHIAGTNGKGSTAQFINHILLKEGNVGLFTSPSVVEFNDRIKINDINISKKEFVNLFDKYKNLITKYNLSFFEIYTLIAILSFTKQKVDYAIFEVGVGGEFDPTNVIVPIVCGITNVGDDHQHLLGKDINDRRKAKLGIQKPGIKLFIQNQNQQSLKLLEFAKLFSSEPNNILMSETLTQEFTIFPQYQQANASLAFSMCSLLISDKEQIIQRINETKLLPGRFEQITSKIILDGAHNITGIKALLKSLPQNKEFTFVFSSLKNKNIEEHIKLLKERGEVYIQDFYFPVKKTINAKLVAKKTNTIYLKNIHTVIKTDKNIIFTGSLYFISNIRQKLKNIYN